MQTKAYADTLCLDLLETLYEVDEQLTNWVSFLTRLTDVSSSRGAFIRSSDQQSGEGRALTGAMMTPQQLASYEQLYHPAAVQQFRLKNPKFTEPGAVAPIDLTRGDAASSPMAQALERIGVGHLLNAVFDMDGPVVFSLTLVRTSDQPAFGEAEIALLQRLLPHMTRAARISRHLRHLASVNAALARTLDQLPVGVILADRQGQVLAKNRPAGDLLARRDGLRLDHEGRLQADSAGAQGDLARLLERTLAPTPSATPAPAATLPLPRSGDARPLLLLAIPAGEAHTGLLTSEPAAALFLSDPERAVVAGDPTLRGLWGLSPTEAKVAQLLVQGRSLPEAAETLGVRPSTARTHLNRIFDKTGTRRQTELVSLLSWSVAALELMREA